MGKELTDKEQKMLEWIGLSLKRSSIQAVSAGAGCGGADCSACSAYDGPDDC